MLTLGLLIAVSQQSKTNGAWDSIHVFEATEKGRSTLYKLTSTVILQLSAENEALGSMNLSGNLTRQAQQDMPVTDDTTQVSNIGKMVEDMELKMRNLLRKYSVCLAVLELFANHCHRGGILWKRCEF